MNGLLNPIADTFCRRPTPSTVVHKRYPRAALRTTACPRTSIRVHSRMLVVAPLLASPGGVTRARVTQVLGLLRLAPEIQPRILKLPPTTASRALSERSLRPLIGLPSTRQMARLTELLDVSDG